MNYWVRNEGIQTVPKITHGNFFDFIHSMHENNFCFQTYK